MPSSDVSIFFDSNFVAKTGERLWLVLSDQCSPNDEPSSLFHQS
jgi:hypothetical protein